MQEARQVDSLEETQREAEQHFLGFDANMIFLSENDARDLAWVIFTEWTWEVLGWTTLQRALQYRTHSVNVRALQ